MQLVIKEKEEFLKQTEKDFSELQVQIVKKAKLRKELQAELDKKQLNYVELAGELKKQFLELVVDNQAKLDLL